MSWHRIWTMMTDVGFKLICFRYYFFWTWLVITFNRTLMYGTVMCDMYVESCMILVVCWLNRDPLWYSTDYRVYMGSSMIVRPLVGCHCTCALINWTVLLHLVCALAWGLYLGTCIRSRRPKPMPRMHACGRKICQGVNQTRLKSFQIKM